MLVFAALGAAEPTALAQDTVGVRALGMGDALRAAAVGAASVHLNPSGMTLLRSYVLEGSYGYRPEDGANLVDASIVDSLTAQLGAGIFFSYLNANPINPLDGTKLDQSGYKAGLALSLPFANFLHVGLTGKYVSYETVNPALMDLKLDEGSGFTMDTGATLQLGGLINLAVVGTNLIETDTTETPLGLGMGVAFTGVDGLVIDFDTHFDFSTFRDPSGKGRTVPRYSLGGELFTQGFAIRAGYINDRGAQVGPGDTAVPQQFVAFGLSLLGAGSALDGGVRQQITGDGDRATLLNIGIRLFVQ